MQAFHPQKAKGQRARALVKIDFAAVVVVVVAVVIQLEANY